jgi:hypothetical protein
MATERFAKGTQLQYETAPASGTFQTIAELGEITADFGEPERPDITSHSTVGNRREFAAGLQGEGSVSAPIVSYDPSDATHIFLMADKVAEPPPTRAWRLRMPNPPYASPVRRFDFNGFVSRMSPSFPPDGVARADLSIVITGSITPVTE